jgi:hypothetical protein
VDGVTKKPKPKKVKVSVFVSSEVARLIRENVAKFDYRGKSQYIEALVYDHDVRMKQNEITDENHTFQEDMRCRN